MAVKKRKKTSSPRVAKREPELTLAMEFFVRGVQAEADDASAGMTANYDAPALGEMFNLSGQRLQSFARGYKMSRRVRRLGP